MPNPTSLAAMSLLFFLADARGEAVAAIVVFSTGVIIGALLIILADVYARRKHGR